MDVKNDPTIVHETVLRDVISLISDFPIDPEKIANNISSKASNFSYKNIAKATRDLTLTFPVIVSDAVSVETASMISKAIERKATVMLQMLFSAIQITNADNAIDYLKKFHSNINADKNMGIDDWISFGNILGTLGEATMEDIQYNATVDTFNEGNPLLFIRDDGVTLETAASRAVINSLPNGIITESSDIDTESFSINEQNLIAGVIRDFRNRNESFLEESYAPQGLGRFTVNTRYGYSITEASQPVQKNPYIPDPNKSNTADKVLDKADSAANAIGNNKLVVGAGMASMALGAPSMAVGAKNFVGGKVNSVNKFFGGSGNVMKTNSTGGKLVTGANDLGNKIMKTNIGDVANKLGAGGKLNNSIQNLGKGGMVKRAAGKVLSGASKINMNKLGTVGLAGMGIGALKLANQAYKQKNYELQKSKYPNLESYEYEDDEENSALKLATEAMVQDLAEDMPINESIGDTLHSASRYINRRDVNNNINLTGKAFAGAFNFFRTINNDKAKAKLDAEKIKMDKAKNAIDAYKNITDARLKTIEAYSKHIIPTDVQKANEMIPTMMVINFISAKGATPINSTAAIGIKARLQYVTAADMADRIISKNEDHNGLFNFIKATTGQISFWKDFIFAIDKAKLDSVASSGKGSSSPVWKMLERRATMSRIRRWTGSVNDAAAISTLVISKDEVEYLKKTERIDLMRPNTVHTIMNAYNIMGFVVVDEVLEKANFLFDDGSSSYETVSFTHLERQGNGSDGAYKKMINLLVKKG